MPRRSTERPHEKLRARLAVRRDEIEEAILTRVVHLSTEELSPECAEGLYGTVSAALDYGLSALRFEDKKGPPLPPVLRAQARIAAQNGVGLDSVVRRYVAGQALLADFVVAEAEAAGLHIAALQKLLRRQASDLDCLLAVTGEEYAREIDAQRSLVGGGQAWPIERLLAGELLDGSQVDYPLEGHHVGLLAKGTGAVEMVQTLARSLGRRLLLTPRPEETVWAWFAGQEPLDARELCLNPSPFDLGRHPTVGVGEPASGLSGWRLTHRQAKAALMVGIRRQAPFTRYADVSLLAAILQDDVVQKTLRVLYLDPLERERDGGVAARKLLRTYLATERNVSSTAVLLGIKRHTVTNRLRAIEATLGRPLSTCATELDAALRLEEIKP